MTEGNQIMLTFPDPRVTKELMVADMIAHAAAYLKISEIICEELATCEA